MWTCTEMLKTYVHCRPVQHHAVSCNCNVTQGRHGTAMMWKTSVASCSVLVCHVIKLNSTLPSITERGISQNGVSRNTLLYKYTRTHTRTYARAHTHRHRHRHRNTHTHTTTTTTTTCLYVCKHVYIYNIDIYNTHTHTHTLSLSRTKTPQYLTNDWSFLAVKASVLGHKVPSLHGLCLHLRLSLHTKYEKAHHCFWPKEP